MASSNRHWPSMFKTTHPHRSTPYPVVCEERSPEPKPRWNPRPEQIRILEAIFNSGTVNPSRDEIRRIRTKLQEFGHVGDANVFYWFQNRKSRTKSKKANLPKKQHRTSTSAGSSKGYMGSSSDVNHYYRNCCDNGVMGSELGVLQVEQVQDQMMVENYLMNEMNKQELMMMSNGGNNSTTTVVEDQLNAYSLFFTPFSTDPYINQSNHQGVVQLETVGPSPSRVTVFFNDVAFDVEAGPFNVRENFGSDAVLVQGSGYPVATDGMGMTVQSLEEGAFYYVVRTLGHYCEWDVNACDNMLLQI